MLKFILSIIFLKIFPLNAGVQELPSASGYDPSVVKIAFFADHGRGVIKSLEKIEYLENKYQLKLTDFFDAFAGGGTGGTLAITFAHAKKNKTSLDYTHLIQIISAFSAQIYDNWPLWGNLKSFCRWKKNYYSRRGGVRVLFQGLDQTYNQISDIAALNILTKEFGCMSPSNDESLEKLTYLGFIDQDHFKGVPIKDTKGNIVKGYGDAPFPFYCLNPLIEIIEKMKVKYNSVKCFRIYTFSSLPENISINLKKIYSKNYGIEVIDLSKKAECYLKMQAFKVDKFLPEKPQIWDLTSR